MKIAFTWDDGAPEDMRLFEMHTKYGIPGMFFVPTTNVEGRKVLTSRQIRSQVSDLISFGGHTKHHRYLTEIPANMIEEEIRDNKEYLEDITGNEILHFCLPGGAYSEDMLPTIYKYYESVRTADTMCFKITDKLVKPAFHLYPRGARSLLGNAIRHGSYKDGSYVLRNWNRDYFQLVMELVNRHERDDSVIVMWGHSWEIEKLGLWREVETIFRQVSSSYRWNCVKYEDLFCV